MNPLEARLVLLERRNWLVARIQAKETVGWDVTWDRRERDALTTILNHTDPEWRALHGVAPGRWE